MEVKQEQKLARMPASGKLPCNLADSRRSIPSCYTSFLQPGIWRMRREHKIEYPSSCRRIRLDKLMKFSIAIGEVPTRGVALTVSY